MVGPLVPLAVDLRKTLADKGYSLRSAAELMLLVGRLSRWLEGQGLAVDEVTAAVVEEFFRARRAEGCRKWRSSRCLAPLLEFLRITPGDAVGGLPVDGLLVQYRDYLRSERALRPGTVGQYLRFAAAFLSWPPLMQGPGLADLTAGQVTAFVMTSCRQRSASQAKLMVTALRSLLRFLHVGGYVTASLTDAVPSVPGWPKARLPQAVRADQITAILSRCDTRSALGRRDYAVILLMARLGLRAGEVAALRVTDVDWRAGQLSVRGKGNRLDDLPMPVDVGQALADYIQYARPRTPVSESLFVRAVAPFGPMHTGTITSLVHRACGRAGITPFGPHRLRHAVACALLAEGASLEEIGQLLRQRDQTTTAVYAKVDLARLSGLAMPCPQGAFR
jgi:site-specific recombinase XerD